MVAEQQPAEPSYASTVELAQGKVWKADDVEKWIAEHRPDLAGD